ncbi:hypothetical protein ACFYO2_19615 [Streptomyces sp. NPDC006602]|uniref:hypothetical protein n=1 Tax=Streptomyces sp. NPDC006602 TaxID=3364751 RepID=UPI0036AAD656
MSRWRSLIIHTWGALSYKPAFQQAAGGRPGRLPGHAGASWVPEPERRRLAAYTVLSAYDTNQAAALLGDDGDDRREYGDASLVVDQTLSHLLGESQKIVPLAALEQNIPAGSKNGPLTTPASDSTGSTAPSSASDDAGSGLTTKSVIALSTLAALGVLVLIGVPLLLVRRAKRRRAAEQNPFNQQPGYGSYPPNSYPGSAPYQQQPPADRYPHQ